MANLFYRKHVGILALTIFCRNCTFVPSSLLTVFNAECWSFKYEYKLYNVGNAPKT